MFSRDNIKKSIEEGHLKIIPYEEKNLTGLGYNISTTNFAFSINQGILLKINTDTTEEGNIHYVKVPPNDTVLLFSKEFLETDDTIAGTFHSKVSRVSQGFSHISTTLDPKWKGQLIIAMNNPTNKSIRLDLDKESGNVFTLVLHKLDNKVTGDNIHNNNQGRCDLLLSHFKSTFIPVFCRRRHLELQNFIVYEFANSLNAFDDFMDASIVDKYSNDVVRLKKLKERLERDKLLFFENRYAIGENGKYEILRNNNEKEIIRECSLFHLSSWNDNDLDDDYLQQELVEKTDEIIEKLNGYLQIIEYQLETINHNRRILWQNEKTIQYASENSKLIRYEKYFRSFVTFIVFIISFIIVKVLWGVVGEMQVYKTGISALFSGIVAIVTHFVIKRLDK